MEIVVAPDAEAAAHEAALLIARRLRSAVRRNGRAFVAFSGGTTPARMLAALAGDRAVPWEQVEVHQVDERVVPDGHPARNLALLGVLPVPRRNVVPMPVTSSHLAAAARRYAHRLPPRFDVVHLGLGDDGHTASWPPGQVPIGSQPVAVTASYAGFRRLTLTPAAVNAAVSRIVLATGAGKATAVRDWLLGDPSLPVQAVRRRGTVVVVDGPAAAALPLVAG